MERKTNRHFDSQLQQDSKGKGFYFIRFRQC